MALEEKLKREKPLMKLLRGKNAFAIGQTVS